MSTKIFISVAVAVYFFFLSCRLFFISWLRYSVALFGCHLYITII